MIRYALTLLLTGFGFFFLVGCDSRTTAAEVDTAFLLCSSFGGVHKFDSYHDIDNTKVVEAECRDGATASRRIKEEIRNPPPLVKFNQGPDPNNPPL